ncbi:hypothetical protein Vafri_15912 [Volvox africanus]|uniref:Uncharacterized protein n=1 Tax=Volvox africanus TaxID=51714 RepID=A0A8J4BIM2_9CHLO|nr:hypothetical protein Vafri_15912 [Volvox africanus]
MLNCLTYIAFVYWAVATVHTVLPIDVAVCGADVSRGGLGALFNHAFGGDLDVNVESWRGFPCNSGLLTKLGFILRRPAATVRHIMYGGGQDEMIVPILFIVPLIFSTVVLLRHLGLRLMSDAAVRTLLKFGVAVGCRSMILLQSLANPTKESVYYKRYSKVEFCIIAWTAYIIELPMWHEALVSGGTAVVVLLLCTLFPHHMLPEVNPVNVATQAVAAAALGVAHAYYQQRRRIAECAARAARTVAKAAAAAVEEEEEEEKRPKQQQGRETGGQTGAPGVTDPSTSACISPAPTPENVSYVQKSADTPDGATGGLGSSSPPVLRTAAAAVARAPSPVSASVAVIRHLHSGSVRPYVSPARLCRLSMKVQHAHLADLPPNMMAVINMEILSRSGWQVISAHAREGCVELVLDLRPLVAARPSAYGNNDTMADDRLALPDQDQPDGAASVGSGEDDGGAAAAEAARMDTDSLLELGRSIVSYLQSTGVIRPDRERSVVLQMGTDTVVLTWQPDTQSWVATEGEDGGSPSAAAAVAAPPLLPPSHLPKLQHISPRVVLWQGPVTARIHLTALISGPSAEEVLAGGGLVVRCGACTLPYTVLTVRQQDTEASAMAAVELPLPPPLVVDLAVNDAPSRGLLLVEARTSSGLLSSSAAVIVHHDTAVVSGLAALAAAMDDTSADAMLTDYGTWLDLARTQTAAAAATSGAQHGDDDVVAGGDGGKGTSSGTTAAADGVAQWTFSGALFPNFHGGPSAAGASSCCTMSPYREAIRGRIWSADGAAGSGRISAAMRTVAADLMGVCCRGTCGSGGSGGDTSDTAAAVAAVADHLIACVIVCDDVRLPADALTALMEAVPSSPIGAGALHMAIAAGLRPVVEVIVGWYDTLCGSAAVKDLWLSRASCGVTPLHVAAAVPDGGVMAAWLLYKYDTAAEMWEAPEAASDDGMTPSALAAQLGGRWWLRPWRRVSGVVRDIRRALTPPAPLGHAVELLWGFRDPPLERRFAEALSGQVRTGRFIELKLRTSHPIIRKIILIYHKIMHLFIFHYNIILCIYIYICVYIYVYIYIYMCVCVCVCVCVHRERICKI